MLLAVPRFTSQILRESFTSQVPCNIYTQNSGENEIFATIPFRISGRSAKDIFKLSRVSIGNVAEHKMVQVLLKLSM